MPTELPMQIVGEVGNVVIVGRGFTVIVNEEEPVPQPAVPVIVYTVVAVT